jgi:four helix bundle protein
LTENLIPFYSRRNHKKSVKPSLIFIILRQKVKNPKTISQKLAEKTMRELAKANQPKAGSRVWQNPEGYQYLVPWTNAVLLRFLIRKLTKQLPKSEYRRKAQLDDAARSVVRNIEEGYKRATTNEYLQFLGYSQGSLEEVKGDIRELAEDGFLKTQPGSNLTKVEIDLASFHQSLRKNKGNYRILGEFISYRPLILLYPPLKKLQGKDLRVEIFMELINKTDWLLRKLVASLERKLGQEQKGYQIERARLRGKIKGY